MRVDGGGFEIKAKRYFGEQFSQINLLRYCQYRHNGFALSAKTDD